MEKTIGILLIIIAILFGWVETSHFGWNFLPASTFEAVCDLTSITIFVVGLLMLQKYKKSDENI